jgi:hypothetical protein
MLIEFGKKYIITSGGNLHSKNDNALTCSGGIKMNTEMKFDVDAVSAKNDKRCHFIFEKTQYRDFPFAIRSAYNKDLYLGSNFDVKEIGSFPFYSTVIKILLVPTEASSQGYFFGFNIQTNSICNYKFFSRFKGESGIAPAGMTPLSSVENTSKGKNLVLLEGVEIIMDDNFLFKITPVDDIEKLYSQTISKYIIMPGKSEDLALTSVNGTIIPKLSLKDAQNNPASHFTIENGHIKNSDGLYWSTNGDIIRTGTLQMMNTRIVLKDKNTSEKYRKFKIKNTGCYKTIHTLNTGNDEEDQLSILTKVNKNNPLVLSWGYRNENKDNFVFRFIPLNIEKFGDPETKKNVSSHTIYLSILLILLILLIVYKLLCSYSH